MAEIIDFSGEPELDGMSREQLTAYLETVRERIARLDEEEPADMESEAYEDWGQRHEDLEDLVDDVLERLEELE